MEPGPRVPSAVVDVYLTPIYVCGQAGIQQPPQGPETLRASLALTLGWPAGALAGRTTPFPSVSVPPPSLCLSPSKSYGEIPWAWATQEGDEWPIFSGSWQGGSAVLSFSPCSGLLHFILPWHLPLAALANILPHSAWDQPKKAATFLGDAG